MESSVFWDAVVAVVAVLALAVSLFNLWDARRAPAAARQRELRDQLRILLDSSATTVHALGDGIRQGAIATSMGCSFNDVVQEIAKIRERLTKLADPVRLVETSLNTVTACSIAVYGAQLQNRTQELLENRNLQRLQKELPTANVEVAVRDLDDACKAALRSISSVLAELNRLESR